MSPNILFIHVDQHRFDCLGVNGHRFVRTPHLDRLAGEGMNFTHAFTPVPVCTPARNALLFGAWPVTFGALANFDHSEIPEPRTEHLPTFSGCLRERGYWLGCVGKWAVSETRTPMDVGFHEYIPHSGYAAWRSGQGLPPVPRARGFWGESDPHISPEQSRAAWGANETVAMLSRAAKNNAPFFIRWDPHEPHLPNIVPEPFASMYPPEHIKPWPGFPDSLAGKPYIQAQQRRSWQCDGMTWRDWAPVVGRYLGDVSLLDAQVGKLLDALDRFGLAENTIVIYTSDHGDMCGSHGMIDKHYVMYDDVVRVPLIVRWPGVTPPASRCAAFVTHELDLARTFCELAGASVPETFQGGSLLPLLRQTGGNGREDILAMYHGNQFGLYTQRMVRDRRWKYVWNATAEDELYDLANDPGEIVNLATATGHAAELARLRRRLLAWMEAARDPILNQWTRGQLESGNKL